MDVAHSHDEFQRDGLSCAQPAYQQTLLRYIAQASVELQQQGEITGLLDRLAGVIRDLPGFVYKTFYLRDSRDFYPLHSPDGVSGQPHVYLKPFPLPLSWLEQTLRDEYRTGRSYIIPASASAWEHEGIQRQFPSFGTGGRAYHLSPDTICPPQLHAPIQAVVLVPLEDDRQNLRGLFVFADPLYDLAVIQQVLPLLELFADQFALIMARIHQREELEALAAIGRVLGDSDTLWDIQKVYHTIYDVLTRSMPIDCFFIDHYHVSQDEVIRDFEVKEGQITPQESLRPLHPAVKGFLHEGPHAILFSTIQERLEQLRERVGVDVQSQFSQVHAELLMYQSLMFVTIRYGHEPIGILGVQSRLPLSYRREHLQMLIKISEEAALAIKNMHIHHELHEALLQAKESEQLKNNFLMTASHELRTPLTAVHGYLELLSDHEQTLPEETKALFLKRAHRSSEELVLIVSTLMDASQIDQQKVELKPGEVFLHPAVTTIVEMLQPILTKEHRSVTTSIPEHIAIWVDDLRLRQILLNLLNNALKYTEPGTPIALFAELYTHEALLRRFASIQYLTRLACEKSYALIAVRDWGPGIAQRDRKHLFSKFVRLDDAINSTQRGAGLGLYLCRQLCEAMGGAIWLESAGIPGEGCTFWLALPTS